MEPKLTFHHQNFWKTTARRASAVFINVHSYMNPSPYLAQILAIMWLCDTSDELADLANVIPSAT